MSRLAALLLVLAAASVQGSHSRAAARLHANPIRKVVTLLQDMQKTIENEGLKQKDIFENFQCYCKDSEESLGKSIEGNNAKAGELASKVEQDVASKSQLEQELVEHKDDREAAQKAVQESTTMREKEEAEFSASSGEMKSNIGALGGALESLKKGVTPALMQSSTGSTIRDIVGNSPSITDETRGEIMDLLQSGNSAADGGSDQIIGVIGQMLEEMQGALTEAEASEASGKTDFKALMAAKSHEIGAATRAIESKMERAGELGVKIVQGKGEGKNTESSIAEDTEMKGSLLTTCAAKTQEYERVSQDHANEISAISEAIKVLNDDDALDLFKKTMPSAPAFLQTSSHSHMKMKRRVSDIFDKLMQQNPSRSAVYRLMQYQTRSKRGGGFAKVLDMIENMVTILKKEEEADSQQKDWCIAEIDRSEDEVKALKLTLGDLTSTVAEKTDEVAAIQSEIDALKQGITALDKTVGAATDQRKQEHNEFLSVSAANQAAIDLLNMAKNKLNKYYNPKKYVVEEEGEDVSFEQQENSNRGEGHGVLALLSNIISDIELDMAETKKDEAEAQKDYEQAMNESAKKRQADSNTIVAKEESKAEDSSVLDDKKAMHNSKAALLKNEEDKTAELHASCDGLLKNFDARKAARSAEMESLTTAKATLSGADFGFLQKRK